VGFDRTSAQFDWFPSLIQRPITSEGPDVAGVSRKAVSITELHAFYLDMARQMTDAADGSSLSSSTS
jgi:hypothetical protein